MNDTRIDEFFSQFCIADYLMRHDLLVNAIKHFSESSFSAFGNGKLVWNDTALKDSVTKCAQECSDYYADILKARDGSSPIVPSPLKFLGHLLFCLTQGRTDCDKPNLCVVASDFKFHDDIRELFSDPDAYEEFVEQAANEILMFSATYQLFNTEQKLRVESNRYNPEDPPMHFRYLKAMVDFLCPAYELYPDVPESELDHRHLEFDVTPYSIYMIFKTMDLFATDTNYQS